MFIIVQLAEAVKRGACSLGSSQPDSQVMVINAVKDVASALGDLINATKLASGKSINDPSMQDLKESARVSIHIFIIKCNFFLYRNAAASCHSFKHFNYNTYY